MKTNVRDKLDFLYRAEQNQNENFDKKTERRTWAKIWFFIVVDLAVLVVSLGSTVVMWDDWAYTCRKRFAMWGIFLIIFSFFSLSLVIVQIYSLYLNKSYQAKVELQSDETRNRNASDFDMSLMNEAQRLNYTCK